MTKVLTFPNRLRPELWHQFRTIAPSVWISWNRGHSEYIHFYVVGDFFCPSLNMNSQIVESWQGKFSVYKKIEPINNICMLEQKQVKESNFLILWLVDINVLKHLLNYVSVWAMKVYEASIFYIINIFGWVLFLTSTEHLEIHFRNVQGFEFQQCNL